MGTNKRKITKASIALALAIKRAAVLREMKIPGLAKKSGVPLSTLRKILANTSVADYEQLRDLADALDIQVSNLMEDAERILRNGDIDKLG